MNKEIVKQPDSRMTQVSSMIRAIAEQEGIPPSGITILGGKPYVNVTGLDVKLKNICAERKLELKEISATRIVEPTGENGYLTGYHAEVVLFDREGYLKALQKLKEASKEALETLTSTFTYRFSGEGFASPDTCEGIGFKYYWHTVGGKARKERGKMLIENIIMMAERRATNRAKREATGTGLTSLDEMPLEKIEETETETVVEPQPESTPEIAPVEGTPHAGIEDEDVDKPDEEQKGRWRKEVFLRLTSNEFVEWCKKHAYPTLQDVRGSLLLRYKLDDVSKITLDMLNTWMAEVVKAELEEKKEKRNG